MGVLSKRDRFLAPIYIRIGISRYIPSGLVALVIVTLSNNSNLAYSKVAKFKVTINPAKTKTDKIEAFNFKMVFEWSRIISRNFGCSKILWANLCEYTPSIANNEASVTATIPSKISVSVSSEYMSYPEKSAKK